MFRQGSGDGVEKQDAADGEEGDASSGGQVLKNNNAEIPREAQASRGERKPLPPRVRGPRPERPQEMRPKLKQDGPE